MIIKPSSWKNKSRGDGAHVVETESGCRDLNPGPPAPKAGALAKLRYIPKICCRNVRKIGRKGKAENDSAGQTMFVDRHCEHYPD